MLNLVQELIIYLNVGVWKGNWSSFLGFRFGGVFVSFCFALFCFFFFFILLLVEGRVETKGSVIKKVGFVKGT